MTESERALSNAIKNMTTVGSLLFFMTVCLAILTSSMFSLIAVFSSFGILILSHMSSSATVNRTRYNALYFKSDSAMANDDELEKLSELSVLEEKNRKCAINCANYAFVLMVVTFVLIVITLIF